MTEEEQEKVAIVTGASRGLGKAIAANLVKEGYSLGVCSGDLGHVGTAAQEIRRGLPPGRGEVYFEQVDVRDHLQVRAFVTRVVRAFGGSIDVLVNNAGLAHHLFPMENLMLDYFEGCVETNLYGAFNFIKEVLPAMKQQNSGVIVNIASKSGVTAVPGLAAYNASKAALISLTQTVAKEVAFGWSREKFGENARMGWDILCCSVSPGGMRTEMRERVFGKKDAEQQMEPEFVAEVVRKIIQYRKVGTRAILPGDNILITKDRVDVFEMPTM